MEEENQLLEGAKTVGKGALYGLEKYGEAIDWTNDQVNLRNALRIGKGVTDRIPGQWDEKILDYSYKDLRDHTAGGIGNVAGFVSGGNETVNAAGELLGQVLLPDAVDFATGGVGYADNLARIPKALKQLDIKAYEKVIDGALTAPRRIKDWGKGAVETITSPIRTAKGLIGSDSIVSNVGTGLDADIAKLTNTLDPNGLQNWGSKKRIAGARFITGKNVQDEDVFTQAGWRVLVDLNNKFGIDINRAISPFQVHHKGVIRQIAESANGLTKEGAKAAGDYISKKVGFKMGYDPSNAVPLPAKFHQRVHDIINSHIAIRWGDNLKGLEQKLNLPPNWQTTMDLQARIDAGIYDEIANGINESTKAIDTFWNSVATRTNLGKLTEKQFMEATFEVLESDKFLSTLQRTRNLSPEEGYTVTKAVNELLERAGRLDLTSPVFEKIEPGMSKELLKILIQKNGAQAVKEVLTTGQSPATIFKTYGIQTKGFDKNFKQLSLPGFKNIKDTTGGKPLGRPKGSKDIKPRRKKTNKSDQLETTVEWNEKDYNDIIEELNSIINNG